MKPFVVYMLRCADGSYYVGHTDELEHRVAQHQAGEIEGYTLERRPVELVWSQETATREEALVAERRIKGWGRVKKEALVAGDWERIKVLARNRSGSPGPSTGSGCSGPSTGSGRTGGGVVRETQTPIPTTVRPEPVEGPEHDTALLQPILNRERRALAKAITLLESTLPDHRERADALLNALLPHTGQALRLGISGVPGVGKSTFIETLGLTLIAKGHRVAVLAIDPSSSLSGGSILGDKTRMERLAVNDAAFIRPSPASGTLGGVAEKTRESMLLCEAAGYDIVIVETVGVGQSEAAVAGMTDLFVLMQLPNAGDDLQAIKKGVMELADLVVVNKADLDPTAAARAQAQMAGALHLLSRRAAPGHTPVMQISALKEQGIENFWGQVEEIQRQRRASGEFDARRKQQARAWMWELIHARLHDSFRQHPAVHAVLADTLRNVDAGHLAPSVAARSLLYRFNHS